jgi:hypothetical protein
MTGCRISHPDRPPNLNDSFFPRLREPTQFIESTAIYLQNWVRFFEWCVTP